MVRGNYDISDDILKELRLQSKNSDLLDELVSISRKYFDFYTKNTSRAFEYVWLVNQMRDVKDKNILDFGAGVSPLPIYFAQMGAKVYTVDNSKVYRDYVQDKKNWNGWGFFNYNNIHENIISYNLDINKINFNTNTFDYIYSISVIEHMPVLERKMLWKKLNTWINDKGSLLLTIDLYRGTNDLWNYNGGKVIESVENHGNVDRVLKETAPYFQIVKKVIKRDIFGLKKIDIATFVFKVK